MVHKSKTKKIGREIAEIVLAFAVAWLGYQGLSIVTGTPLPIVAVVSDSMYHTNTFDGWWDTHKEYYESIGMDKERFLTFPFRSGLSRGDLLLVVNQKPNVGDVVIYEKPSQGISIVHRLVAVRDGEYIIKGDNNFVADAPVSPNQFVGKVILAVPLLGYPRFLLFGIGI